jgi:hypothetical protein
LVARGRGEFSLLISASTAVDSSADHLQIIGWDATHHVFHFYERLRVTFFWASMSRHALEDATRGRGPFDSHVNGALVMKELRSPWIHWHAPQAGINEEAFAPDDPLRHDPLFRGRVTAERLEIEVARPAIRRWNEARVAEAIGADGVWRKCASLCAPGGLRYHRQSRYIGNGKPASATMSRYARRSRSSSTAISCSTRSDLSPTMARCPTSRSRAGSIASA